jgi:hypothetical protein
MILILRKHVEFKKIKRAFKLKSCWKEMKFTATSIVIIELLYTMQINGVNYTSA